MSSLFLVRGGLLGLAVAAVYLWVAPTHIVDGDNAEFATLGSIGGTAHPSGYPLYLLLLRAMQWLPSASPAHTAALTTALIGAAAIVMLHAACRAWGAGPVGATLAAALFAGAPIVIRISTEAEVFALNNLVVASVLWLAAQRGPARGMVRVVALCVVAGLGLANHMTCALIAPVGLLGVVRGVRESQIRTTGTRGRTTLVVISAGLAALVLGLTPYLYVLVTPDTPLSWGKVDDLGELVAMIARSDYGGPGAFLPTGQSPSIGALLASLGLMLARSFLVVGLVASLVMLVVGAIRGVHAGEPRWGWALLLVSFAIAGPLLVMRFNLEPTGLGLYVCQRFYVLPALMLVVPLAVALRPLDVRLARTQVGERGGSAIASTVGFLAVASLALPHLARVQTPAVEQYVRNMLHAMPKDAVLFTGRDEEYLGLGYLQWALGDRQDVTVVASQLTAKSWYQQRIARRGIVAPDGEDLPILRVIDGLLAAGRPVFVEKARSEVLAARPAYPFATVMRVLPNRTPIPSLADIVRENEEIYARFEFGYPLPGSDDEFATAVHRRYAATWTTLARWLERAGDRAGAARASAFATALSPRPGP